MKRGATACWSPAQWIPIAMVLAFGCNTDGKSAVLERDTAAASGPADSLVASSDEGIEIWFTLARVGQRDDGAKCVERGLEIRRGDTRIQVPLLYTGSPPVLLDGSTMRAELWNHCRPVDTYLVDLQSGRPVRQRAESAS